MSTEPIESLVSPDNLVWSPDNNWLALNQVSGAGLLLLDVQTNEYVSLVETYYFGVPSWSPVSSQLAFIQGTREDDEVKTIPESENMQNFTVLSWSPNGQWLLTFAASEDRSCLYLINPFNGDTYCAIDTTGTLNPFEVFWLPEIPHLP